MRTKPITGLDFDNARWDEIKTDSDEWWRGKFSRPIMQVRLHNASPTRKPAKVPYYSFQSFYDLSVTAADIIDAADYELSRMRFMGDAFPHFFVNFGPGVIAAFLGCLLKNGGDTVWFIHERQDAIEHLKFNYDKENIWFGRIKDIMAAAVERWQGNVQVGMTDLGGNLDILASFRPNEGLLFDLYDHPDKVKCLTQDAHELWWKYFDELNAILQPANPGYTSWCPIFSVSPHYMLQCDFSYMIGPDMFDEFVRPELAASCKRLSNVFYHLDGNGQLAHLDSLLEIPNLKGIQWVPGAGAATLDCWPQVYRKIHQAGKLIHIYGDDLDVLDKIAEQIGSANGIIFTVDVDISQQAKTEALLEKWN